MRNILENDILKNALDTLKMNIDLPIDINLEYSTNDKLRGDALLKIKVDKMDLDYYVEIKTAINKATIGFLLHQQGNFPYPQLLVAEYINPNMAEELRKNGIQFIDINGNAYINNFPLYIFIKGNKANEIFKKALPIRAFQPTGLRMIYALLCDAGLANKPYREIARAAGIALGTVGWVFRGLREVGFLIDMGKRGKRLLNKKDLFDRWCTAYIEKLRPKLMLGTFEGPGNWWKGYTVNPDYAQWGGEVAANIITKYLKPQDVIIYLDRNNFKDIILNNRLRKNDNGDIEILERFWVTNNNYEHKNIVHPLLIYADLLATGNQRNIEAARMIYEQYIIRYLRED